MKSINLLAALTTLAATMLLFAAPASAQATRTWVSGVGDDANPCSRTAPCKTFAGAISKTAAFGEINCLDPGGFGAVTITKSLTIDCQNLSNGGVLVAGTNGIVVNVSSTDFVQLIGLDLDGIGPTGGALNGVLMNGSGNLAIINCLIYGFGSTDGTDGNGVFVNGTAGAHVLIQNSVIRANIGGVSLTPQGGVTIGVTIDHSIIDSNSSYNLSVNPGGVFVINAIDLLNGNAIANGGGQVVSFGNNIIRGAGAPTQTLPLQ